MALPGRPAVVLVAIVAASIGATSAMVAFPLRQPATLRTAPHADVVPVTTREDADERQVQLALSTGAPRVIGAPRVGVLTSLTCVAGGVVRSGDVVGSIDGEPVIALATSVPLWRDLYPGTTGPDVRALQEELARLGTSIRVDGVLGSSTATAVRAFTTARGVAPEPTPRASTSPDPTSAGRTTPDATTPDATTPDATTPDATTPGATTPGATTPIAAVPTLRTGSVAWLPAPESTTRECVGIVGAPVAIADPLVDLPVELRSARIEQLPVDPASGARVVQLGDVQAPVGTDGVVSDAGALDHLTGTPEYATAVAAGDDAATVPAAWGLAHPVTVQVVPPTSLWDLRDGQGCLRPVRGDHRDRPRLVTVAGSELGQSFVTSPTPIRAVVVSPSKRPSCR